MSSQSYWVTETTSKRPLWRISARSSPISRGPRPDPRAERLADLVVDGLDLLEERVAGGRQHVHRRPERQVPAGAQELPRPAVAHRRIDPVPRGGGDDRVVRRRVGRPPRLEVRLDDLDVGEPGQIAAGGGREGGPELDAGELQAAGRERARRLARGAADLEHPIALGEAGAAAELVKEGPRVLGPRPVVPVGGRVEGRPQRLALVGHGWILVPRAAVCVPFAHEGGRRSRT